nr:hypothetical protein [Armatimonadota bacterium]
MRKERERLSPLALIWTLIKIVIVLFFCFVGTAAVLTFRNFTVEVPNEKIIDNYTPSEPTRIISYDGVLLAVI